MGVIGSDGCLRLVGRIKDMIRVGGENVAAAEIEAALLKHDAVKQAVAIGMADPRLAGSRSGLRRVEDRAAEQREGARRLLSAHLPASKCRAK